MESQKRRQHRASWQWIVPLLLLAMWLGARGLNADSIWFDEWWSIYHAGGAHYGPLSPADTWMRVAQEDPRNTPGYYLLLQAWGLFTGWTPFAGRALSLLIGLLTIGWVYRLGRDLVSPTAGLGAAVVLGTGTFFTYYLHELRGYMLYALLTAVCAWAYWRILAKKGGWATWLSFFLSMVGLLYTHYFASLTLAAIGLYHLLLVPKNARWWRVALVIGLAALAFVPWLAVLANIIDFFQDTGATTLFALDARSAAQGALYVFSNGSLAMLGLFALFSLSGPRRAVIFTWFWALSALLIGLAVNEWLKVILNVRYLMALWPVMALIVGLGVDYLTRTGVPLTPILCIWLISGLWNTFDQASLNAIRDTPYYLPWKELVTSISGHEQTADLVLFLLPDQRPLRRSAHEPVADYYLHDLSVRHEFLESPLVIESVDYEQTAREYLNEAHRVWVAYDPTKMPDYLGALDQALVASHILCGTFVDSAPLHLNLYGLLPAAEEADELRFGDGIMAVGLPPYTITNDRLNVLLIWTVDEVVPDYEYSVALHLEKLDGTLAVQGDYSLPAENYSCHSSDMDVSSLAPGDYTLLLGVRESATGERLAGINATTGDNAERLILGTVTIPAS